MKKGVFVAPTINEFSDPQNLVDLAVMAEEAGWDGYFICDHLLLDPDGFLPLADPTVVLSAVAAVTERVMIGAMVTPISRRRPWKVAKEFATLDQLSNGRVVIGVGLGGLDQEFSNFDEDPNKKVLAKKTDEGLEIIQRLHTGEVVNFSGDIYNITGARLLPRPTQRPRIPVWVGAMLPAKPGQRRAARWDGIMPHVMPAMLEENQDTTGVDMRVLMQPTPDQIREVVKFTSDLRESDGAFDIVVSGITEGMGSDAVSKTLSDYEDAGGTWWLEWLDCGRPDALTEIKQLIQSGPPS